MKTNNTHKIVWEKFLNANRKEKFVSPNDRALVALSGGPDSMCTVHLLLRLRKIIDFELAAAYIDHGLRPKEVKKEIEFVKSEMKKLNIPAFILSVRVKKTKLGLEANARAARYDALTRIASNRNYNKIATGHTIDDQAETVLLNILRSKCDEGIEGIPEKRQIDTDLSVIRPIISIRKEDILKYLKYYNIKYCIDSSNLKSVFRRNLLRLKILPILKSINPSISEHLSNLSKSSQVREEYICEIAKNLIPGMTKYYNGHIRLDLLKFMKYNFCLQQKILKVLLTEFSTRDSYSKFIKQIFGLLESEKKEIHSGNLHLSKSKKSLILRRNYDKK